MGGLRARADGYSRHTIAREFAPVSRSRLPLVLLFAVGTASAGSLHGIMPDDINRSANACTDFFDYANGTWRKQNPIPDHMDRWSRRWESGEINKEHVRDILTEMSAKKNWPQVSPAQLSGDYYAACMDDSRDLNQRGLAPAKPWLDEPGRGTQVAHRRAAHHFPFA